jgi:hypothetical protein
MTVEDILKEKYLFRTDRCSASPASRLWQAGKTRRAGKNDVMDPLRGRADDV